MKRGEVPQDTSRTYGGVRKLLYAVDDKGRYVGVNSAGWDVETYATVAAIDELLRLRDEAWTRANNGTASPLEYHMYRARLDPVQLAAATGFWRWQVKRHLRPAIFQDLKMKTLERYAGVMGLSVDELQTIPDHPDG